jgi:hypothetical protein
MLISRTLRQYLDRRVLFGRASERAAEIPF